MTENRGTIPLFRVAGVDVRLHWLWILVAAFEVTSTNERYTSLAWNIAEYISLFLIVLLHEFCHVGACRSVGGKADRILLWPLGGLAYVTPPPRPGATLWTIAAGPLLNLALVPVFLGLIFVSAALDWEKSLPNLDAFVTALAVINAVLLIFNLLPIYPLDGGQILRALLWFVVGRSRSLLAASGLGFLGVAGLVLLAVVLQSPWAGIMAFFVLASCFAGWKQARNLARAGKAPPRPGFACPACSAPPAGGPFWLCPCGNDIDPFVTDPRCTKCGRAPAEASCHACDITSPLAAWAPVPLTTAPDPERPL